ncbi:transposase [Streptomyces sp. NBC_01340]|uniref:transposase n=1 Tax=Streptomyces sp. NBC_01340 TaxID=2903830 RepID=UPI003DA516D2
MADRGGVIRRRELSDAEWEFVGPLLPVSLRDRKRLDDREVLNGFVGKFRTGTAWRDVPERYVPWATPHTRFRRRALGTFERMLRPPRRTPTRLETSTGRCRPTPPSSHRQGQELDRLLPALVAGGVLASGGETSSAAEDGAAMVDGRRTLSVLEQHFGLCPPRNSMMRAQLTACTVRGTLALGPDPDLSIIRAWAADGGYSLDWGRSGHVPSSIREAYSRDTSV